MISPISVRPRTRPAPVGSIAYSAGRTTVTRITIAAINAMINVTAGTFTETVNVNKTVTLSGANAGTAGNDVGRVAESLVQSPAPPQPDKPLVIIRL